MSASRWPRRWPLALLAMPAGVATWSGWVGLGRLTESGEVTPLPGIADRFQLDTAITLPIGVEAYAAMALASWLSAAPLSARTRGWARWSALGALVLGMLGQVAYHVLVTGGATSAPTPVTVCVSCLPVLVLGAGAALAHMLHRDRETYRRLDVETSESLQVTQDPSPVPGPVSPDTAPALAPAPGDVSASSRPDVSDPAGTGHSESGSRHDADPDPAVTILPGASGADMIRSAVSVLGSAATPVAVHALLAHDGHDVKISNVRTVMRRMRQRQAADPAPAAPVLQLRKINGDAVPDLQSPDGIPQSSNHDH